MGQTIIGVNDPKAVKKYSVFLALDGARDSYFSRKFMGAEGSSMPIQVVKDPKARQEIRFPSTSSCS